MMMSEKKLNYCKICNAIANSLFTYPDNSVSMNLCTEHFNSIYNYYVTLAKQVNANTMTLKELITQLNAYISSLEA